MPFVDLADILGECPDEWRDDALRDSDKGRPPEVVWEKIQASVEDDIAAALSPAYTLPAYDADADAVPILRNVRSAAKHLTLATLFRRRRVPEDANPFAKLAADSIKHLRSLGQRELKGPPLPAGASANSGRPGILVIGEPSRLTPSGRRRRGSRGLVQSGFLTWLAVLGCLALCLHWSRPVRPRVEVLNVTNTINIFPAMPLPRLLRLTASPTPSEPPCLTAYRGVPLTLRVMLDISRPNMDGWEKVTAEIRRSRLDSQAPLAVVTLSAPSGGGPLDLPFDGDQTNQDLAGAKQREVWIVIYASRNAGETLDVLYAGRLMLLESGISQMAAAPPNMVGPISREAADARYPLLTTPLRMTELPLLDATAHAADQIDGAIQGLTASDATKKIFTTENHAAGIYVRNENCWAASFDLTGLGVAWQSGGIWTTQLGFTAITPRHVVMCHHTPIPDGSLLRFVAANGAAVDRVLTASVRVGATDVRVGLLATALPSTIRPLEILPAGSLPLALTTPVLATDQEGKALVAAITNIAPDAVGFSAPSGSRGAFYELGIGGDSGHGLSVIFDGRPALLSLYTSPSSGPRFIPADIQFAADSLLPGSAVETMTLAGTVDWTALTNVPGFSNAAVIHASMIPLDGQIPLVGNGGRLPLAVLPGTVLDGVWPTGRATFHLAAGTTEISMGTLGSGVPLTLILQAANLIPGSDAVTYGGEFYTWNGSFFEDSNYDEVNPIITSNTSFLIHTGTPRIIELRIPSYVSLGAGSADVRVLDLPAKPGTPEIAAATLRNLFAGLPTSPAGLPAGTVWRDGFTLKIS